MHIFSLNGKQKTKKEFFCTPERLKNNLYKFIVFDCKNLKNPSCHLNICTLENSKQVLWQTVKTKMKCSIMLHFIRVLVHYLTRQNQSTKKEINNFGNSNMSPLNIHNGPA